MHSILTCYSNSANYTGAWGKAPPYETNKNELHSSAMDKQQRHVKMLVELLWSHRLGNSYAFHSPQPSLQYSNKPKFY